MKLRRASGVGLLLVVTACNQNANGPETANVAEPANSSEVVDTVASASTLVTTTLSKTTTTSTTTVPPPIAVSANGNPTLLGGAVPTDGPLYFLSEDPAWALQRLAVVYGSLPRFPLVVVGEGNLAERARVTVSVGPGGGLGDSANNNTATMGAVIEPVKVGGVETVGRTSVANDIPITELTWPLDNGYAVSIRAVGLDLEEAADLAEHIDVEGTTPSLRPSQGYRSVEAALNPVAVTGHFVNGGIGMDVTCSSDGEAGLATYQMASFARTTSHTIAGALVAQRADPPIGPDWSPLSGAHWANGPWWCIVRPMPADPNGGEVPVIADEHVEQFLTSLVIVDEQGLRAGAPNGELLLDPGAPPPLPTVTPGEFSLGDAGTLGAVSAQFTPDGGRIVVVGLDTAGGTGTVLQFIDAETGAALASFPITSSPRSVTFSPDGTLVFDGSNLRDTATGEAVVELDISGGPMLGDFSPDGTKIAVASMQGGPAALYSTATGERLASYDRDRFEAMGVEFLPDGKRILLGSHWGNAVVWDIESDREVVEIPVGEGHIFLVSGDGRFVAIDEGYRLVDTTTGLTVLDRLPGFPIVFSRDGNLLAVSPESPGPALSIWDTRTLEMVSEIPCGCVGRSGSWSSGVISLKEDGSRVVIVRDDRTSTVAEVYDTATGALISSLSPDDGEVLSAAYSPDGTRIVTANRNGTVRLWPDP